MTHHCLGLCSPCTQAVFPRENRGRHSVPNSSTALSHGLGQTHNVCVLQFLTSKIAPLKCFSLFSLPNKVIRHHSQQILYKHIYLLSCFLYLPALPGDQIHQELLWFQNRRVWIVQHLLGNKHPNNSEDPDTIISVLTVQARPFCIIVSHGTLSPRVNSPPYTKGGTERLPSQHAFCLQCLSGPCLPARRRLPGDTAPEMWQCHNWLTACLCSAYHHSALFVYILPCAWGASQSPHV